MKYVSTRDKTKSISSSEAILHGISSDGGLFWPETIPQISQDEIRAMAEENYHERAKRILGRFLTDFTREELDACVEKAYTSEKFSSPDIAPLKKINDREFVLELWHGPTCAFKDMALQILPYFLTTSMKKTGTDKQAVILVATSGDTGKAALEGFCDVEGTRIIVFYPRDGVSCVQKQQMVTQKGSNTFVAAVEGNFDDCQTGVKAIFANHAVQQKLFDKGYTFSSANSINWGRLVPQVVYYFSAYADLLKNGEIRAGEKINFVVPTGNFGDILAGYVAKHMGLPVAYLVCASNKNKILTDFIHSGTYDRKREFFTTMSPSMDILISSNLERLLFAVSNNDDELIREYMSKLSENGSYTVNDDILIGIQREFLAGYTTEESTVATIGKYYEKYGYVADPHTAVALNVFEKTELQGKTVVLSTASPYKFPHSVCQGIAPEKATDDEWALFDILHEKSGLAIPASLEGLKERPVRFEAECEPHGMVDLVTGFLE